MASVVDNFKDSKSKTLLSLFLILPITLIIGSAASNATVLLINFFFIFEIFKEKKLNYLNNKLFYILIFIWFCLLTNSIIIANNTESLTRSFGFLRFIFLIFALKYVLESNERFTKNFILQSWFIIFIIVTIDVLIEFFTGTNTLGFSSNYNGRIASFTGDELKIGNYYFGFILISLSFFYEKYFQKYQFLFYLLIFSFLLTSFFIGERSNFIKVFLISVIFIFLINNQNIFRKVLILALLFLISYITILNNVSFHSRFIVELINPLKEKGISKVISDSQYGKHYEIAQKIYMNNKIFGVGIKNYRIASADPKYNTNENLYGVANHPHQIHYEILSETGIVGYFIFIIFFISSIVIGFKNFFKNKNPYILSSTLFILATALPFIPSGSFFTSYGATIFWINYAFLFTNIHNINLK